VPDVTYWSKDGTPSHVIPTRVARIAIALGCPLEWLDNEAHLGTLPVPEEALFGNHDTYNLAYIWWAVISPELLAVLIRRKKPSLEFLFSWRLWHAVIWNDKWTDVGQQLIKAGGSLFSPFLREHIIFIVVKEAGNIAGTRVSSLFASDS
jgi:hypothetical protein